MMDVHFELWQLITLLITFLGAAAGAGKLILSQSLWALDSRFLGMEISAKERKERLGNRLDSLEAMMREDAENWRNVERDLLQLKADMPLQYVRREDYIRGQSVIEAKLDSVAGKLENWQLRSVPKGEKS